jgi:hypothetical protein
MFSIKKIFLIIIFLIVSCSVCNAWQLDGNSRTMTYGSDSWYKTPAQIQKMINKEKKPGKLIRSRTWDNGRLIMYYKADGRFYYFLDNRLVRLFYWNSYEEKDWQKEQRKRHSRNYGIYTATITTNRFGLRNYTWHFKRSINYTFICNPNPQELRRDVTTKEWRDFLKQKDIKSKYDVWNKYETFK